MKLAQTKKDRVKKAKKLAELMEGVIKTKSEKVFWENVYIRAVSILEADTSSD